MPEAVVIEVADAVVAALVEAKSDLEITIDAVRSYGDVNDDLIDLDKLKIDVIPLLVEADLGTTSLFEYPHVLDVLVRKKFGASDQGVSDGKIDRAEIDKLVLLIQRIWELFAPSQPNHSGRLETETGYSAAWDAGTTRLVYLFNRAHLKRRQFTGYIRLGYRVSKEPG